MPGDRNQSTGHKLNPTFPLAAWLHEPALPGRAKPLCRWVAPGSATEASPHLSVSLMVSRKFNGTMQLHYLKSHNICGYDSFITVDLYIYLLIKEVILGDARSLLGNNYPMLYILYMLYKQSEIFKSKCWVDSVEGEVGIRRAPSLGHPGLRLGVPGRVTIPPGSRLKQDPATARGRSLRLPGCFFSHGEGERRRLCGQKAAALDLPPGAKQRTG